MPIYRTAPNLYKLTDSALPTTPVAWCSYNNSAIPSRCSFHYFFSFFVAAAFASPSSPSSATSTIASPQPTATVVATAAERVISRDVDEVEVIPKRRRGRSIPPPLPRPPLWGLAGGGGRARIPWGNRMARGARFALAASNPPPPRGRSRRRVRWWTCAPAYRGWKIV